MKATGWLDGFVQDLRYAARYLRSSPAFTTITVLTLGIGIGATTAIFSAVNATLLRPLPFPRAGDLVSIRTRMTDGRVSSGLLSPAEITSLKEANLPIMAMAGVSPNPFTATLLRDNGRPVDVVLTDVTEGFFHVLGLPTILGQGFSHQDFLPSGPNAPLSLVASYRVWTEMFGRDPAIVGRPVRLAEIGLTTTITGVAGPSANLPKGTDFWVALRTDPHAIGHSFVGIIRLRAGTPLKTLRTGAGAVMASLARANSTDLGREFVMQSLLASIVGDLRSTLLIVLGATGLLLLAACLNVTELLLARGAARTRELAMRAALGASRARLIRQLVTEALAISFGGSILGVSLAYVGVRALLLLGASKLPRLASIPFDARVLLFVMGVLIMSALAMGCLPAWRLASTDLQTLLNESSRSATPGRRASQTMSVLIVVEVALALMLAAGAGWLVKSFAQLKAIDPGFTATGRVVASIKSAKRFGNIGERFAFWDDLLEHVRGLPGVRAAGSASTFPLRTERDGITMVAMQGEVADPDHRRSAHQRVVTPGFFDAMGVKLLEGRDFVGADRQGTMPVAIVNQAFVHIFLQTKNPLATQFITGFPDVDPKALHTIVGVVPDIRYASLAEQPEPTFYVAEAQTFAFPQQQVVVAARAGDPRSLIPGIRSEVTRLDPQALLDFETVPDIVEDTVTRERLGMALMLIFGAVALLLAAIGIYGAIAYACAQRQTELATRIALGASATQIFWLVIRSRSGGASIGLAIGVAGAYLGGRLVASHFYEMRAADPSILMGATIIVGIVTFLATTIPAISSSRLGPARALRAD